MIFDVLQVVLLVTIIVLLTNNKTSPSSYKQTSSTNKIVVDTCALIDGRLVDLVRIGFINQELIVPQFVIAELQQLADGRDAKKRERARFGLDIIKQLQLQDQVRVTISTLDYSDSIETDDKLVKMAKDMQAQLYTTDFNLNKVASIAGVSVLNIHELAGVLRMVALPGERMQVKIIQKGATKGQGIAYLEDGTMLVVDNAAKLIGKKIEVIVTRVHQTDAGKMIFANLIKKYNRNS